MPPHPSKIVTKYFRKCRIPADFVCCSYLQNISQVGTFLILKSDDAAVSASKPPALWRVDGKTLIQKYESIDGERRYKCVNTYSGWTANTRYAHRSMYFCSGYVDIIFF